MVRQIEEFELKENHPIKNIELGDYVTGAVDIKTGDARFNIRVGKPSLLTPIALNLIYSKRWNDFYDTLNSLGLHIKLYDSMFDLNVENIRFGNGWKTNYEQYLILDETMISGKYYRLRYVRADGQIESFKIALSNEKNGIKTYHQIGSVSIKTENNQTYIVDSDKNRITVELIGAKSINSVDIGNYNSSWGTKPIVFKLTTNGNQVLSFEPVSVRTCTNGQDGTGCVLFVLRKISFPGNEITVRYSVNLSADSQNSARMLSYGIARITDKYNNSMVFNADSVTLPGNGTDTPTALTFEDGLLTIISSGYQKVGFNYQDGFLTKVIDYNLKAFGAQSGETDLTWQGEKLVRITSGSYLKKVDSSYPLYSSPKKILSDCKIDYNDVTTAVSETGEPDTLLRFDEREEISAVFKRYNNGDYYPEQFLRITSRNDPTYHDEIKIVENFKICRHLGEGLVLDVPHKYKTLSYCGGGVYCGAAECATEEITRTVTVNETALPCEFDVNAIRSATGFAAYGIVRGQASAGAKLKLSVCDKRLTDTWNVIDESYYDLHQTSAGEEQPFLLSLNSQMLDANYYAKFEIVGNADVILVRPTLRAVRPVTEIYNSNNLLISKTDPDQGTQITYEYDKISGRADATEMDGLEESRFVIVGETVSALTNGLRFDFHKSYAYNDRLNKTSETYYVSGTLTEEETAVTPTQTNPLITEYTYDSDDRLIYQKSYYSHNLTKIVTKEYSYNAAGKPAKEKNEFGEDVLTYKYTGDYSDVSNVTYFDGGKVFYEYNEDKDVSEIWSPDCYCENCDCENCDRQNTNGCSRVVNSNSFGYRFDYPVTVESGTAQIDYEYGPYGVRKVKINGATVFERQIADSRSSGGNLVTETIKPAPSSGLQATKAVTTENGSGEILENKVLYGDEEKNKEKYNYDNMGFVTSKELYADGVLVDTEEYTYDNKGRTKTFSEDGITYSYDYDNNDNVTAFKEEGNSIYEYTYSNPDGNKLARIDYNSAVLQSMKYDEFGRLVQVVHDGVTTDYYYESKLDSSSHFVKTSSRVSQITHTFAANQTVTYEYQYDAMGKITQVKENGIVKSKYTYDKLNRLVKETGANESIGYAYSYDDSGNITKRTELTSFGPRDELHYVYATEGWKDRLVGVYTELGRPPYGNTPTEEISYDNLGRPTVYRDKTTRFDYAGRLDKIGDVEYTYDYKGRRETKTYGNSLTQYYYIGDKLDRIVINSVNYEVIYGLSGVVGFGNYDLVKNALGDVTALVDTSGRIVARYVYSAWGEVKVLNPDGTENTDPTFIGNVNPFRYRTYLYDEEAKLYYLTTRYYDPELGRFISPDGISYLDPKTVNGLNLYAYCLNNPVMGYDPEGTFLIDAAITGFLAQANFSIRAYVCFAIAAIWDEDVRKDMNAIHWNPFNTNEEEVLNSSKVSFYKGVPVIRQDGDRSGTFLGIFLSRNEGDNKDIVKHEYGHAVHQMIIGPLPYLVHVGIPSYYKWGPYRDEGDDYYNNPQEAMADILGGSSRAHTKTDTVAAIIWFIATIISPLPLSYLMFLIFHTK